MCKYVGNQKEDKHIKKCMINNNLILRMNYIYNISTNTFGVIIFHVVAIT